MFLDDVRVVDLTNNVAGPFASLILADLGAKVMKIERPNGGDDTRTWGPPFWESHSAMFLAINRNKESVALDLKAPRGRDLLFELIASADVLLVNLTPAALRRLGLSYESARTVREDLIYCEISGYGPVGPLAELPAYDAMMQAFGGLMSLTGEPGGAPSRVPVSVLDQGSGMWAATSILAALRRRERTGAGAHIQTSLLQTALMWLPAQITGYLADGIVPGRNGSGIPGIVPYQAFPTSDGHILIAAGNDGLFRKLCDVLDRPDLVGDPRYSTNPARVRNRQELVEILSAALSSHPVAHWLPRLETLGVPASAIHTVAEVVDHPQVRALGAVQPGKHPDIPDFRFVSLPTMFDGQLPAMEKPPPLLGEHTAEVLAELGYTDADIQDLAADGTVATTQPGVRSVDQ
jgi:crotonobetainyl-CoA:carnitine CoA-transferase CaiB-like acyl-CoA transferase